MCHSTRCMISLSRIVPTQQRHLPRHSLQLPLSRWSTTWITLVVLLNRTPPPTVHPSSQILFLSLRRREFRQSEFPPHVLDRLPEHVPTLDPPPSGVSGVQRVILYVRDRLTTAKSSIGRWREYLHRRTFDPDSFVPLLAWLITATLFLPLSSHSGGPPSGH